MNSQGRIQVLLLLGIVCGGEIVRSGRVRRFIPTEFLSICGIPPERIDTRFHDCVDFRIVPVPPPSTQHPDTAPAPTDLCSVDDQLNCNGMLFCGGQRGYQCCGFERYHPGSQTCCQYSSAKYRIHDDMPEKSHICCEVNVFRRGSTNVPCEHPSSNDKLFRGLTKPKRLSDGNLLCNDNKHEKQYISRIDVKDRITNGYRRHLQATISMWPWQSTNISYSKQYLIGTPAEKGYMNIPLDKYSPGKKNLIGKSFFTITNVNYLEKAVFFLSRRDNVYKWPKSPKRQRKITKRLKRVQRKCRKLKAKRIT